MHRSDSMPMVSIRPSYVTFYSEPLKGGGASHDQSAVEAPPERTQADGIISAKASTRICQSIDWLLYLSKPKFLFPERIGCKLLFRVNFITLSLSSKQVHDDNTVKQECLQPFLDTMRKTWGCIHYVWRVESQKNGNIHIHIITDKYIAWWKIRKRWNACQNRLGYVDRYVATGGTKDPNSTDVHSIKKVKKLGAYMSKYFGKNPDEAIYTALKYSDPSEATAQNDQKVHLAMSKAGNSCSKRVATSPGDCTLLPCYNPSEALKIYPASAGKFRSIGGNLWGLSYSLSEIRSAVACIHEIKDDSLHEFWKRYGAEAKEYDYHTCIYIPVNEWGKHIKGDLLKLFKNYVKEYKNLRGPPT